MKIFHHLLNNNKLISKYLYFLITIFYIIYCFKLSSYEIIFMDERLLIDDIYNVWLLDDSFGRFRNIENNLMKSSLIVITEFAYGGDLRYGRLWSNIFTIFIGLFTIISDQAVIIASRLLNLFILNLSFYLLSKTFISKKYLWISMLSFLSLPGIELLIRIPKPDVLGFLFISIGLIEYKNNKYFKSILYFSIASFLKINFILIFVIFGLKMFQQTKKRIVFIFKGFGLSLFSLYMVNPILIIPPINLFGIEFPNFYLKYYEWVLSQGSYGQDQVFSFQYFVKWLETINTFYLLPKSIHTLASFIFVFLLTLLSAQIYRSEKSYSRIFILVFTVYMLFYMFFIERQFSWYITTPFIFLSLTLLINLDSERFLLKKFSILFILLLIIGNFSNIHSHHENKLFSANYKLGYTQITNEKEAIFLVDNVLNSIDELYLENESLNKNVVLWNPNLFIPRNKVTYFSNFFVREYWGPDDLNSILSEADIFVTNEPISSSGFKQLKVNNYYLFYK